MSLLWKLGGVALACLAAYFLVMMYGTARYEAGKSAERVLWQAQVAKAEKGKLDAFRYGLELRDEAEVRYVEKIRQLPPVTNTIIERSTAYAQTPDGIIQCLPADRVLWLEQNRARLFPATGTATSEPVAAVQADATRP